MAKIYASAASGISERERRNAERSGKAAAMGMVLLENHGGLPLHSEDKKIALFGNGARNTVKGGSGSGDVNSRKVSNIEEAFLEAGYEVTTSSWLDRFDAIAGETKQAYFGRLMERIATEGTSAALDYLLHPFKEPPVILATEEELKQAAAQTAVYILARNSGEGADRKPTEGDFRMFPEEKALLEQLISSFERVIVVLNVGGVIDTSYFKDNDRIKAVLLMGQGGVNGAKALVEVLTGAVTPCGHLTTTWAASYTDYPCAESFSHMNGDVDDEYYNEGIYVGYRYFDTFNITPNYPFGYGKSYTTFDVETADVKADEKSVNLTIRVTNTGEMYSGREVVQVYTSAPAGILEKPYQELAAFAKTKELAPGESEDLSISFAITELASYDSAQASWILESGEYLVRVGTDSRNTEIVARILLRDTVTVQKLNNHAAADVKLELMSSVKAEAYSYPEERQELENAPVIELDAEKIPCETAVYKESCIEKKYSGERKLTLDDVRSGTASLDELVSQLSVEEMAQMCVGTAREGIGAESMIGAAANMVPGAAGETSPILSVDRNVSSLILADGPAGLRLSSYFMADSENNIIPGTEASPLSDFNFMDGQKAESDLPEGATTYYQYCTAIPIATLLAQTWDLKAIEEVGNLVGEEMEEFGVHLWLAPGMNIHRNPLCGRNFEYYSEDPLLSGKCAAAETRGVQRHKGCGTTIKHFACNNQEDNRTHTNAHVSERALREIYLKGFEIAIKEARPKSLMTSYNLLNGIHTANSYDLITAVARQEWGFQGVVMTDWGTTGRMELLKSDQTFKYGCSSAAGCIKAGNDIIMPGSQDDVDEIIRSVGAKGETERGLCPITLAELQDCVVHILQTVLELAS